MEGNSYNVYGIYRLAEGNIPEGKGINSQHIGYFV